MSIHNSFRTHNLSCSLLCSIPNFSERPLPGQSSQSDRNVHYLHPKILKGLLIITNFVSNDKIHFLWHKMGTHFFYDAFGETVESRSCHPPTARNLVKEVHPSENTKEKHSNLGFSQKGKSNLEGIKLGSEHQGSFNHNVICECFK